MSTIGFSFVSCGSDGDDGQADGGGTQEENYTLYCAAMFPQGLLKIGTVYFVATNPETGEEEGFTMPDSYGNDYTNSVFSPVNEYLAMLSATAKPERYFVRYIVSQGKKGQSYSMKAAFKLHEKETIATMANQNDTLSFGTISLYPIVLSMSKGSFTSFDMNSASSSLTTTIAGVVEKYDYFKEKIEGVVSKNGVIE
ncbi:MAG: hypothetical protein ACI4BA_07985 [Prevotella sp.]